MLSWPRGPHPDDGVWGRVWYENTNKSTCFIQQTNKENLLSDYQKSIVNSAYTYYEKLESFKQSFCRPIIKDENKLLDKFSYFYLLSHFLFPSLYFDPQLSLII